MSTEPADPVAAEDGAYIAIVSEYHALRRAGASLVAAAVMTSAYRVLLTKAGEDDRAV